MAESHADKIKTNQFANSPGRPAVNQPMPAVNQPPPGGPPMNQIAPEERFPEDKPERPGARAMAVGMVALAVILLFSAIFLTSSGKSSLIKSLRLTYPAPNYEITMARTSRSNVVHKVNDGSKNCSSVGYVHITHQKTGMSFDQTLCKAGGGWSPTYYQRLLDEAAVRYLDDMESGNYNFGFGNMVDQMVGREASNYAQLYNRIPAAFSEEEALKTGSVPALAMVEWGGDWSEFGEIDDESEDFEYSDYNAIFYLAHAVVYPDQSAALLQAGLIRERP